MEIQFDSNTEIDTSNYYSQTEKAARDLYKAIIDQQVSSEPLASSRASLTTDRSSTDQKTQDVFLGAESMVCGKVVGGLEGNATFEWGGKDGPKYNIGFTGDLNDKKGNHANFHFEYGSDGKGKVGVSGGHKKH